MNSAGSYTAGELADELLDSHLHNIKSTFSDVNGNPIAEKYKLIWHSMNDALDDLYGRFNLEVDELFLAAIEGRTKYEITTKHFMTGENNFWPAPDYEHYLWRNEYTPWKDNLLQIISVTDHHGHVLPMNNANDPRSVFTPKYNIIQIPAFPVGQYPELWSSIQDKYIHPSNPLNEPKSQRTLGMTHTIQYKCTNPEILGAASQVDIPKHLKSTLLSNVAYLVYKAVNSDQANNAYQNFQGHLENINRESLIQPGSSPLDNRFSQRGFR